MRRVLLLLVLTGCPSPGTRSTPAPEPKPPVEPAQPTESKILSKEECEAQGGRVNASIGGGSERHCALDEQELAPVRFGIEGGWCCKPRA